MNTGFTLGASLRLLLTSAALSICTLAAAADPEASLVIRNHRFEPAELKVAANQRVKLTVHNQDDTPEEFESHQLNREKLVPPGAKVVIFGGDVTLGNARRYA